jgi:acyl dehydratase
VFIDDTITPELEVTELVPKTDTGLLRLTTRVKNQRGEVVLAGMHAYLIKKRPRT